MLTIMEIMRLWKVNSYVLNVRYQGKWEVIEVIQNCRLYHGIKYWEKMESKTVRKVNDYGMLEIIILGL